YVQQRIREAGAEVFAWLERGAHFYICGDAKKMAKDVQAALRDVVAAHGGLSIEEAAAYVETLKASGRYQADVY
ncbi:MAG: assimilatory sulfite reductase (NADPH) flavoprotein subunit, partial [Pseudoxanthomonas sp.]